MENARQALNEIPGLLPRMAALMGVDFHGEAPDTVELLMERMWKYNQTYSLAQGVCNMSHTWLLFRVTSHCVEVLSQLHMSLLTKAPLTHDMWLL